MGFDYGLVTKIITEPLGQTLGTIILLAVCSFAITRDTRHIRLVAFPLAI